MNNIRLLLLLSGCLMYSASARERVHQYAVVINPSLTEAQVHICFDGKVPAYLAVDYRKATKKLLSFPKTNRGHIEFQGRYWKTNDLPENACINYRSDISAHFHQLMDAQGKSHKISFQRENTWLWLPETLSATESTEITFSLPKGSVVSVPWQLLDGSTNHYKMGKTPHDWGFTVMLGEFDTASTKLANGSQLNMAFLPNVKQKSLIQQWVLDTANALSGYLGAYPLTHTQVILTENSRFKSGPVPWGEVKRGGGFGISFVIDSNRPIEDFYADWTAPHEFSHLLVPNIEYQDIWMSEGLASYLQYILMAQTGQITEQQAWDKLYQGFSRGAKGTSELPRETLLETTSNRSRGSRHARTMRMYWSGAAYFMMADWQLRAESNGKQGLPQALSKLAKCCLSGVREWSGVQLAEKLDQLSNSKIFAPLYQQIAFSQQFPDVATTYQQMGMQIQHGKVVLSSTKQADIRQNIVQNQLAITTPEF